MGKQQKNDDIRRTTRIIQIDKMLRGGSYVKIASLVRKFRVSQRTVERDFERLRDDLNAPLEYDKSKNIMKKLVDLELGIWNNPGRFEEYEILFAK